MRALRENKGLTQAQLAEMLGVSQAAYSRFEKGEVEITLSKLFRLVEIYSINVSSLLDRI